MRPKSVIGAVAVVAVLAYVTGFAAAGSSRNAAAAAPAPTPIVIHDSAPADVVYQTPPECIEALDLAAKGFGVAGDAVNAVAAGNSKVLNAKIKAIHDLAAPLAAASSACRLQAAP